MSSYLLLFFVPSLTTVQCRSISSTSSSAYINQNDTSNTKNFRETIFDKLRKGPPLTIQEELGTSPAFKYEYFDPLKLANDDNFAYYREAELKHGRIAMFATIGMTFPQWNINIPVSIPFVSKTFDLGIGHPFPFLLSKSHNIMFKEVPCGIKAIYSDSGIPWQGWVQIIGFIGFLETNVFVQKSDMAMPGDYQIGYFGLIDKGRNERSLLVELEHGRLAMLAFIFQFLSELATGETVLQQWRN